MANFNETEVERAALEYFQHLGYWLVFGPHIAPNEPGAERASKSRTCSHARLG